jgi:Ni/Fe-hydrogenase subunit HybB-like protein
MVLEPGYETYLFLLEMAIGLVLPLGLLLNRRLRESRGGLYLAAVLVVLGFITNRLNVSITGMEAAAGVHYMPKWTEIAITASIIAVGFFIFALAARYLAIFPEERPQAERRMPAELSHVAAD